MLTSSSKLFWRACKRRYWSSYDRLSGDRPAHVPELEVLFNVALNVLAVNELEVELGNLSRKVIETRFSCGHLLFDFGDLGGTHKGWKLVQSCLISPAGPVKKRTHQSLVATQKVCPRRLERAGLRHPHHPRQACYSAEAGAARPALRWRGAAGLISKPQSPATPSPAAPPPCAIRR
ncbi:MAG: hypothetical protein BJ554DRAFT_7902 [Olpidium bornovanus]|uniref:Uncharacterized protein n=1 Tax=Olpidium bornovanus TaxID=278681 RepID=A0A8H7ZVA2_9FUNG|nr:MAG: hypothetical protein BJ554DRAFT_7902 [Olpidium bornovanus]